MAPGTHIKSHEVRLVYVCCGSVSVVRVALYCQINRISLAVVGECTALFMVGALRTIPREDFLRVVASLGRHMRCLAMAVAIGLSLRGMSLAADPRFPDWPCSQIKVPEISVAAVWAGPSIDDVGNAWEEDAAIRDLVARLAARQDRPDADQGRIDELTNRVEWDTRIFEERRKTMSFVCEVPVLIEQRLFALARAIQQSLE